MVIQKYILKQVNRTLQSLISMDASCLIAFTLENRNLTIFEVLKKAVGDFGLKKNTSMLSKTYVFQIYY